MSNDPILPTPSERAPETTVEVEEFGLALEIVPVKIRTAAGTVRNCTIREMVASERDRYLQSLASRMRYSPEGKPAGVKNFDALQGSLVSLCLFDEEGKSVPLAEIQAFPSKTTSGLYKIAARVNALNELGEAEAKND